MARGRKPGSVSFVKIKMADLNNLLKEDAYIPVYRGFAEQMGLRGEPVQGTKETAKALTAKPVKFQEVKL